MNGNVIRTITIRGTSEGLDKLQTDLTKLAAAHKDVAIAAEETDKKTLSLEQSWKRQTLRLDEAARAQNNIARETKLADQALREGLATQAQHARQLELINQRYTTTASGAQTYGKALQQGTGEARLARHEMINLSRQIQDVGVSLASGQAPLTVLVQQGSQIADVFATSSGTIGGFFRQVGAGAAGFLTSAAGMATGAAAIGTALVVVGSNYASAQREIQKGLSGIGAASGVTRDQINQIAEATSSWSGQSVSQAREAATAFAATGKIYAENVGLATKVIDDYVRAGGDASEMTKTLAAAMQDPAKGALELNKTYGFLNATTLENIRLLQAQGKEQQAAKVLLDALSPAIQKQAENVSIWARAWNVATNAMSAYFDDLGKAVARTGERATGANLGGFSDEERLGRARERVSGLQATIAAPRSAMQAAMPPAVLQSRLDELKAAQEEVAKLEKALDQGAAAFNKLSIEAQMAADGFMPLQAQIRETEQALAKLQQYQAAGGYVDPAVIAAGELLKQQLRDQEASLIRQNEYTLAIAASYPGMSIEVAKQLDAMQGQLTVAQALTDAEKIIAQEYVTQHVTLAGIKTAEEAAALAAGQRVLAEANVDAQLKNQIKSLEDQLELIRAAQAGNESSVKGQQAYQKALDAGGNPALAEQIGLLTEKTAEEQKSIQAAEQADREEKRRREEAEREAERQRQKEEAERKRQWEQDQAARQQAMDALSQAIAKQNEYLNQQKRIYDEIVEAIGFAAARSASFNAQTGAIDITRFGNSQYWQKNGQDTQFNPEGYGISIPMVGYGTLDREAEARAYEARTGLRSGEYTVSPGSMTGKVQPLNWAMPGAQSVPSSFEINEQGRLGLLTRGIDSILGQSGTIQEAFNTTLSQFSSGMQEALQPMNQLIELAPKDQQQSMVEAAIDAVRKQPATLEQQLLLKQLTDKLQGLANSTDALNATMQNALSPYYSQDPRTTKLGFRAGVVGNPDWMVAGNANPLTAILGAGATAPGMAGGGSFIVGGGYSSTDNRIAQFPVASGEQVVVNRRPGGQPTVVHNDNRIIIQGSVDQDTLSKLKISRYQQSQRARSSMSAA